MNKKCEETFRNDYGIYCICEFWINPQIVNKGTKYEKRNHRFLTEYVPVNWNIDKVLERVAELNQNRDKNKIYYLHKQEMIF